MDIKHLLVFLATIVLIRANFTDLQTEVTETKQELHNLQILVSDLRSEQRELRQLSNDHVILHWLKNTVMDLRREMNQLAMTQQERNTASDQRLENKMQEMRLGVCKKPCTYKRQHNHHLKTLSEEVKHLKKQLRAIEKYHNHHIVKHHPRYGVIQRHSKSDSFIKSTPLKQP